MLAAPAAPAAGTHTQEAYEPKQFHITRNGLSLLAAYVMHLIDIFHATIPR